jgi:sodium/hydrogen antiporter
VLFGASLIWGGFTVLSWPIAVFALVALLIRPVAFLISLAGTRLDFRSRMLIAWFGPRGLSSLLLILLPVFAAVPGTESLFFTCCFFVLVSIALHGGSLMFLKRNGSRARAPATAATNVADNAPTDLPAADSTSTTGTNQRADLITIPEMRAIQQSGAPHLVLDVRAERSLAASDLLAQGAVRIQPDRAVEHLKELGVPRQTWLFAFCA